MDHKIIYCLYQLDEFIGLVKIAETVKLNCGNYRCQKNVLKIRKLQTLVLLQS